MEVDLLDPDPTSGVGELLIRGQNVVAGYWNKPDKAAETFVDGWLHTLTGHTGTVRSVAFSPNAG